MEKKDVLGTIALLFFLSILFTPIDSNIWSYFLAAGIAFGIGWFRVLE